MAAFKYLVMGAISSLLVLFAIGLLYALTGSLNMADITARLADVDCARRRLLWRSGALVVGMHGEGGRSSRSTSGCPTHTRSHRAR